MNFNLLHPRDQLVAIMNRIYQNGMTTLSGGNLSICDENGDVWITPAGIDKGKLAARDIMCVRGDGAIEGLHWPSSEYPFHRAIYARRPDLGAIVHAHPPALVSFSIVRQIPDTRIIPQANRICGPVGYAPYALPGSEQLGENIATTFAEGYNIVILENHGLVAVGASLLQAFQRLETLDFCARTLIRAAGLGKVQTLDDADLALFDRRLDLLPELVPAGHSSRERELRQQIVEIVHTAYAITASPFNTRTIPECFILLRDIPLVPFRTLYQEPQTIADTVSLSTPVLLIENDCVLTVGKSVLEAFDRLEVVEYSARSLIEAAAIGRLVPIGDDEIRDLEINFC